MFLSLAQGEQLSRVLGLRWDGVLQLLDELVQLLVVALERRFAHLSGLIIELRHLRVPELVELVELIQVSLLDFRALA